MALATGVAGAGSGCAAIAGIQEGHPGIHVDATAPGDDAAMADVSDALEATRPGADATLDAPSDSPGEATADGPAQPPPELACSLVSTSSIVVDDTRNHDAGGPGFIQGLWIARTANYNQIFVFSQLANDDTRFLEYDVDFNTGVLWKTNNWQGITNGAGVQLVSVSTVSAGANMIANAALATYPGPISGSGPTTEIQIIDLPSQFGGLNPYTPFRVAGDIDDFPTAVFFQPTPTSADFLVATEGRNVSRYGLVAGRGDTSDGGGFGAILSMSTTTAYSAADVPFLDIGGAVYAFVSGVDPDGGATVFRMPEDLSYASPYVIPGSTDGRVLVARPSATDSTKALVLAAVPDSVQAQHVYGALVDPSQLQSLAIGAQLRPGAVLGANELPSFNTGLAWMDDETALVGPGLGGTSLNLVWLGPNGRAVSHPAINGPIVDLGTQISASAVQFEQHAGETSATLYVAWITSVDLVGNQRITAAKVSCSQMPGGGG
jgi:hypothetical protein